MIQSEQFFDTHASDWDRKERLLLSDYTARPSVMVELGPVEGLHVLDLGCGEGYMARMAAHAGASTVFGVDISEEMILHARERQIEGGLLNMSFRRGDVESLDPLPRSRYDRIMAVFLFNYLSLEGMVKAMRLARAYLARGGRFVFTVPHPCFPYMRDPKAPFFFDTEGRSYLEAVNHSFEGRIWRRDGLALPVGSVHRTFADYMNALAEGGFYVLPKVLELGVTEEHLACDPGFFGPLKGYPLHLLFRLDLP